MIINSRTCLITKSFVLDVSILYVRRRHGLFRQGLGSGSRGHIHDIIEHCVKPGDQLAQHAGIVGYRPLDFQNMLPNWIER